MPNLDFKFYFAVFLRRLPYFLVVATFLSAIGITVAYVLPPVYRSAASILVERQQISGDLAQSTVPIDPYEQAQIIQQRLLTRANLLELADRIGLYDDQPEMSAGQIAGDIRRKIDFIGFEPDVTQRQGVPGATIIGIAFEAPTPEYALKGTNELVNLVLQENARIRTDRAGDTSEFFEGEVERLAAALERKAEEIADFKTANVEALPDSLTARRAQQEREQERLLALEREEAALRNQRATVQWVYQRSGRGTMGALSPEEEELQSLRSQLIQLRAVYAPSSARIRMLETRIAALEGLVEDQRSARAMPDADGNAVQPMSELDAELAPIDARLEFIEEEKRIIGGNLAELNASVQATPNNERVLSGLERELANLQTQYNNAVERLGQAQVGERIEVLGRGERFSLIEPPSAPGGPIKPRRVLIAGAGVAGGLGLGFGLVVLLELLNRSIRRPSELSSKLGIQPFATIPYIRSPGERRWKRGVILGTLLLVGVVLPLILLAVHTLYLPLDVLLGETLGTGA
jgi:polysaccharide biosynthesis transport protein